MLRIPTWVRAAFLVSLVALVGMLWLYLARHVPLRYFAWFCLLTGAYVAVEVMMRKLFAKRIEHSPYLKVMLELVLGILFVTAFYLFAVYVYPGMR
jgi:hypothetical protein